MKTEELMEQPVEKIPHFDGHEFDGLREALEQDAETVFNRADQLVREHRWVCMAIAAAAGFVIGRAVRR